MVELRPEAKFGAVLPRRMIYNFLRNSLKKPKPITWQKKPKKFFMKSLPSGSSINPLQIQSENADNNECSSTTNSLKSMNVGKAKITIVDIFKCKLYLNYLLI